MPETPAGAARFDKSGDVGYDLPFQDTSSKVSQQHFNRGQKAAWPPGQTVHISTKDVIDLPSFLFLEVRGICSLLQGYNTVHVLQNITFICPSVIHSSRRRTTFVMLCP